MEVLVGPEELIKARDAALAAVSDMPDDHLKTATYQTILAQLVQHAISSHGYQRAPSSARAATGTAGSKASGTTSRIMNMIDEGFFAQPRSLKEIRERLAEDGFHYRLEDLGTPLMRFVQRKRLRRSQFTVRGKKVWMYSNH
jgi:hypothetical protein